MVDSRPRQESDSFGGSGVVQVTPSTERACFGIYLDILQSENNLIVVSPVSLRGSEGVDSC